MQRGEGQAFLVDETYVKAGSFEAWAWAAVDEAGSQMHPEHPPLTAPEHDSREVIPQEPGREARQARRLIRRRGAVPRSMCYAGAGA
jgi:hypothetical protein